jgi:serine/threonine-protein kinase
VQPSEPQIPDVNSQTDRLNTALAGRYRIERHLGAGGMATVYLAEDLKHDRKVALKVLKPELAAVLGAERFVVEIKTTASLQHPHILPLFDSGTADGFLYYVMPFIEGETLRDKLNRETQLGVDEAVRITREVADALDYAHRRGVIHRDIKPENILLHDGRPMVADFGIALAVSAAAGGRMTETGLSLGTPHYMSPEQATADKEITGRSDVYSRASVLYEMLSGNPPHVGSSAQQIIMKIIAEPVQPVTALRKSVPPNVAAALARALEKLPADRFTTASAFAEALANTTFAAIRPESAIAFAATTARKSRGVAAMSLAIAAVATVVGAWGWLRPREAESPSVIRYVDALLKDSLLTTNRRDFALSPDGRRMVLVAGTAPNQSHLLIRERNQLTATMVPGSERAATAFFSPDGRRVGFITTTAPGIGSLKVASLDGSPPKTIAERISWFTANWESDGYIYVQNAGTTTISRVREGGGEVTAFTKLDTAHRETAHRTPKSMHDGRRIVFVAVTSDSGGQVAIADLSSGNHRLVGLRAFAAWYATSGHLVYVTESGALMAVPFDARRERIAGDPEIVAEGFVTAAGIDLDLSADGTLMYFASAEATHPDEILWLNRDGSEIPGPPWTADFADLALSPDGKQLVVGIRQRGIVELWVRHVETGSMSRLTFEADGNSSEPAWTLDGSSVGFVQAMGSGRRLVQRRADGSTPAEPITSITEDFREISWTRDGMLLADVGLSSNRDIVLIKPGADTIARLVLDSRFSETAAAVSPDGRWLAYVSNESGRPEVYVRPFADPTANRVQVSTDGGVQPQWSSTGRELYFVRQGSPMAQDSSRQRAAMLVVDVRPGPTFAASNPKTVFNHSRQIAYFGVTPDGKRFVIVTPVAQRPSNQRPEVVIIENWTQELTRRPSPKARN